MHTMTELRDVTRKVIYGENYGDGIQTHREIQAVDEALKTYASAHVQTEVPVDLSNESMFLDIAKTGD